MTSSVTKAFRELLLQLPMVTQEQAARAYALWRTEPYHNSLQFKRVSQRQPIYSVRDGKRQGHHHEGRFKQGAIGLQRAYDCPVHSNGHEPASQRPAA